MQMKTATKSRAFHGRSREIGQIRSACDTPEASLLRIDGMRGVGKSALVLKALQDFDHLIVPVPALPDPSQRMVLRRALSEPATGDAAEVVDEAPSWEELFTRAAAHARPGRPPFVLVLDDSHRLSESRARFERPLLACLHRAREEHRPFHMILVGQGTAGDGSVLEDDESFADAETMTLAPLPLRAAKPMLPRGAPRDVLRAYGVLGGVPRVLQAVDRDVTLETNIRKMTLEPEAPFSDIPAQWLERDLQTPSRYNAVLARLALGECDWGALHEAVPDLTSSGQLAPYVRRLEELGLIEVRRSLDAAPASRARRYQISDPFLGFWYRFIRPLAYAPPSARDRPEVVVRSIRRRLDEHLEAVFPLICRQHMGHDAMETLGANARELGSLWTNEHEIPAAGILTSGAAFYGACFWRAPQRGEDPLGPLDKAARETRYGFGREHRLRILFTSTPPPRWLERAVMRGEQAILLGPDQLAGTTS
ncbi:MAG: ATP-binding protein [Gemmatimonadota bacterium]